MIIIELSTAEKAPQYARKPYFVNLFGVPRQWTTYIKADAKQFKTVKQAHAWLARRGLMIRTRAKCAPSSGYRSLGCNENYPEPFTGFELLALDTTE